MILLYDSIESESVSLLSFFARKPELCGRRLPLNRPPIFRPADQLRTGIFMTPIQPVAGARNFERIGWSLVLRLSLIIISALLSKDLFP